MSNQITATQINELRQQTGAGMMDCRKALIETDGDLEKAIDYLRKKGQKVASARSEREAKEGVVIALTNPTHTEGVILCLACETDFVAKNESFVHFAKQLAEFALQKRIRTIVDLKAGLLDGVAIFERLNEQVAKIGEKIDVTKYQFVQANSVISYIHGAYRLGVLVAIKQPFSDIVSSVGKDVAMQIAAMNPLAVDASAIPIEVVEREKSVIKEQVRLDPKMAGKTEEMIEKIVQGKLQAFYKDSTLLAQTFVKDGAQSVEQYIHSVHKDLKIDSFVRINLG